MAAVQEHLAQQLLEVALVHLGPQAGEHVLVAQVVGGQGIVVEPPGQGGHGQRHAVGVAEAVLAHGELGLGDGRAHQAAIQPAAGQARCLGLHRFLEALQGAFRARRDAPQLQHGEGLRDGVGHERLHVGRQPRIEQRALERRLVRPGDGVQQYVGRHHALALGRVAQHEAQGAARVLGRGGHGAPHAPGHHGALHGQRVRVERAAVGLGQGRQVLAVEEAQEALGVQVAVERDVAVVGPVVAVVAVQVRLVGERGDGRWRAARLEAVGGVGEQRGRKRVVEHRLRVGQRALHLVVHHAVVHQLVRRARRQLKVPAFLLEHRALVVDGRLEHRVQVHLHEILEVLGVGGRHRVHGLVGERHGVQERLHGRLQQVDEGLLDGEPLRAAQHRVLQNVEDARVIGSGRLEAYGECLVRVAVLQEEQARAAALVAQDVRGALDLCQVLRPLEREPVASGRLGDATHQLRWPMPSCWRSRSRWRCWSCSSCWSYPSCWNWTRWSQPARLR